MADAISRFWSMKPAAAAGPGHTVRKFTTEGSLLMTLGEADKPAETGFEEGASPVQYSGGPFNRVTNVAVTANGDMFIADGYGNARIHHFTAAGELVTSWGAPGQGRGQFNLPHGIAVDKSGRVFVADRENSRIQIFDGVGNFLESWDWVNRPDDLFIDEQENLFIAELGWSIPAPAPRPHFPFMDHPPMGHAPIARVTICDLDGNIQTRSAARIRFCPAISSSPTASGPIRGAISMSARWSRLRARSRISRP